MTPPLVARLRFASPERLLLQRRELAAALLAPVSAGAPLPQACRLGAEDHPSRSVRIALGHLAGELESGRPLSDALADLEPLADEAIVGAARTGERSGRMAEALAACERAIDARLDAARGLSDALAQPLLSLACAGVVVALLAVAGTFRVLRLATVDPRAGGRLTTLMTEHPAFVVTMVVAITAAVLLALRATSWSARVGRVLDVLPLVRSLRVETAMGLACRQVALMTQAGVPLDEAIECSLPNLPGGSQERRALAEAAARLRAGDGVAGGSHVAAIPLAAAVLAAPASGDLPPRFARVARWHEAEAARFAANAQALAGSLAIVAAGIACGAIVIMAWGGYFSMVTNFAE